MSPTQKGGVEVQPQKQVAWRCQRRVQWNLREILRGSDGVFTLYYDTPDGAAELRTRSVALTVPAYVAADLVRAAAPNASDALKCFDYPPVGAVTLAYPLSAIRDDRKAADGSLPGGLLRKPC